jgi:hypothetical protein
LPAEVTVRALPEPALKQNPVSGTVHGRDKVRQQMMQWLGASAKLGLVLDDTE